MKIARILHSKENLKKEMSSLVMDKLL